MSSPPETGRPLRADARRNRARLVEVATEVFAASGIAAPIDEIAAKAGVGVGTVYRHFPTKEALFEAVVLHSVEQVVTRAQELSTAADPMAAFVEFFTETAARSSMNKGLHEALTSAGVDLRARMGGLDGKMLAAIELLLGRAQQTGEIRKNVTVRDIKALLSGIHAMNTYGGQPELLMDIVLTGLRPHSEQTNQKGQTI